MRTIINLFRFFDSLLLLFQNHKLSHSLTLSQWASSHKVMAFSNLDLSSLIKEEEVIKASFFNIFSEGYKQKTQLANMDTPTFY